VSNVWTKVGDDIDGEAANDQSGHSVALSADGSIVAIGARFNDGNGTDSGNVRVYEFVNNGWIQLGDDIDGEAAGDLSGHSVALSKDGTVVAIGAWYNDGNGTDSGHVRVYEFVDNGWIQVGGDIDGEAAGDNSGISVALSDNGTIVAIGARFNDGSGTNAGHARVYEFVANNGWIQVADDIDGEVAGDYSGQSVALSADGSVVAIGAHFNDGNGTDSGHVRVYNRNVSNVSKIWRQLGGDIEGEAADDYSGTSVALSKDGHVVAISARANDGNGSNAGHVRVYEYDANNGWTQLGGDIDGEAPNDQSGWSVALSANGRVVAIGARENDGNGNTAGHVRVYEYDVNNVWTQVGGDIDGEAAGDYSGANVALSDDGSVVAIGAYYNDGNGTDAGHVRVYHNVNNVWTKVGDDIEGEAAGDNSGHSVALSADGAVVAIGSLFNDGTGTDAGHVRVYEYDDANNVWLQVGDDIDGEAADDRSGFAVVLNADGTVVAIGAYENDDNGIRSGHVRVYSRNVSNEWEKLGVDIDGEAAGDFSGISVALSADGSVVAIGAVRNDGNGTNAGHVRVYELVNNVWTKVGDDIDGEAAGDESGYSVALSADGTVVAIGAHYNDGNGTDAGHVRVYNRKVSNVTKIWTKLGGDIDGEAAGDETGQSVAVSANGRVVAIGAWLNDVNGTDSGHVRVYEYNASTGWTQLGGDIDGEAARDYSGWSVALSADGTIVAIGAWANDGGGTDSGHVRVYRNVNNVWTKLGDDIYGQAAGDNSGISVALSADGTVVAIGARGNDDNGNNSGHVHVYDYDANNGWRQLGGDIDGEAANDQSGHSVALSPDGRVVAIGSPNNGGNGTDSGHVRVYSRNASNEWVKVGGDIDSEAAGDMSGWSIALSADGTIVAIGARYNSGNGTRSGHVRVYRNVNNVWIKLGGDIDGEAAYDRSGWSVALSADGSVVAIGARYNDGNGTDSGHVRVYEFVDNGWIQVGGDIDGEAAGDNSGISVALSADGSVVVIGATRNDGNGNNAGHVRVYLLFKYDEGREDYFGDKLTFSADGNLLAVGSKGYTKPAEPQNGDVVLYEPAYPTTQQSYIGRVQVFKYVYNSTATTSQNTTIGHSQNRLTGKNWLQHGQDIYGIGKNTRYLSVALSAGGSRIAVGWGDQTGSYPQNSNSSGGTVRVFDYNEERGIWQRVGDDRKRDARTRLTWGSGIWSTFGWSLALSADGTRLAVGDNYANYATQPHGSGTGAVFTYDRLRDNTLYINKTLRPRATDLKKSGLDLTLGTQTVVKVYNSDGEEQSNHEISQVGDYTVEYTSTNSKGEITKQAFSVNKYI